MVVSEEPSASIEGNVDHGDLLSVGANIAVLTTAVFLSVAFLVLTAIAVFKRGEIQPLKIRSSKLLFVSVLANLTIVVMAYVIQMAQEICINQTDNIDTFTHHCKIYSLELLGLLFGMLIISTAEPLAFVSQVLRAIRLRRIIDAQQSYFNEQTRPTELIARFQEKNLMKIQAIVVGFVTLAYLVLAVVLYFANNLFMLPSYDSSSYSFYSKSVD